MLAQSIATLTFISIYKFNNHCTVRANILGLTLDTYLCTEQLHLDHAHMCADLLVGFGFSGSPGDSTHLHYSGEVKGRWDQYLLTNCHGLKKRHL